MSMILGQMSALFDSISHRYWKTHASELSRELPSMLPSDLVYIILRYVPSWQYLNQYDPDESFYDCELQFDPWQHTDIDEPRAFGDY